MEINKGFENVIIKDGSDDNEGDPYRQYSSFVNINGKNFQVIARISLIEKDEMFFSIFGVTIGAISIFLIIMFLINKFNSQKIFKDFYNTLKNLENFSIADNIKLNLTKSKIEEFTKLNIAVEHLAEKASSDYRTLKEFTEETNHEIQTPVAVIKSKLDILLQSNNLTEVELNNVNSALGNLNKLERINKSILLLNKLEYKNIFNISDIQIKEEIENILSSFQDFISSKNILVDVSFCNTLNISANLSLINILLTNIFSNAIRHNFENGMLSVELKQAQLTISNTGVKPIDNTDKFFDRFYREGKSNDSVGLGLTIVKKICDLYGLLIKNSYDNGLHTTTINFKNITINKVV